MLVFENICYCCICHLLYLTFNLKLTDTVCIIISNNRCVPITQKATMCDALFDNTAEHCSTLEKVVIGSISI